jgi:hypothetical protein
MFKDGLYKRIYFSIINKAKTREKKSGVYVETHHIIPKSIGGLDKEENLVKLTPREHMICHFLLMKITNGVDSIKMAYAFNMMCAEPVRGNDERTKVARFELSRRYFSKNHPTKNPQIVEKIRSSLLEYYRTNPKEKIFVVCGCGCGTMVKVGGINIKYDASKPRFVNMEHYRTYQRRIDKPKTSEKSRKKMSDSAKKRLQEISPEEMSLRMKKTFGSCDHTERGRKISESKKGKSTNQQKIVGEKYSKMTDEVFNELLVGKPSHIITRMRNLREKYIRG